MLPLGETSTGSFELYNEVLRNISHSISSDDVNLLLCHILLQSEPRVANRQPFLHSNHAQPARYYRIV